MTNSQWYAVRINTTHLKPWELGDVISIWNNHLEARQDCEKRFNEGQKGVHVTTYENVSKSPTH